MLEFLTYVGVAVFAVSGAISAGRRQLDVVAVVLVALVTALGGGTLRDLMIDARPLLWIGEPGYIAVGSIAAVATMLWQRHVRRVEPALVYADAVGLALFSVLATERTMIAGLGPVVAVVMGVVTSITGGILRDILCGNAPLVMRGEVYVTCALLGSAVFLALRALHVDAALLAGALTTLATRVAAIRMGLRMPGFVWKDEPRPRDPPD